MLKKGLEMIGDAATTAYVAIRTKLSATARELKEDVSGMEIIQVVMIIAIGVVAVAAVWIVLGDLIQERWGQVTGATDRMHLDTFSL